MALQTRAQLAAIFVTGHTVTEADMDDLINSIPFYVGDIGYTTQGAMIAAINANSGAIQMQNMLLMQVPVFQDTAIMTLELYGNELHNYSAPAALVNLQNLDVSTNHIVSLIVDPSLTNIRSLNASSNNLTSYVITANMALLNTLDLSLNQLTSFTIDAACINFMTIDIHGNQLTQFILTSDNPTLTTIYLSDNMLNYVELPAGLAALATLDCSNNALDLGGIATILSRIATNGTPTNINFKSGTNASHSTWTAPMLANEATVVANGGSVESNA